MALAKGQRPSRVGMLIRLLPPLAIWLEQSGSRTPTRCAENVPCSLHQAAINLDQRFCVPAHFDPDNASFSEATGLSDLWLLPVPGKNRFPDIE